MVGRRELNKAHTRERLVNTALDLFEERGFDDVTIEEVAAAADIAPRTFFRYFPSKEALLFHDADEQLEVLRASIVGAPEASTPMQTVQLAVATLARHTAARRERYLRMVKLTEDSSLGAYQRSVLQPLTEQVMADAFAERMGVDRTTDGRPLVLALLGMTLMSAVGERWRHSEGTGDVEGLIEEYVSVIRTLTR